MIKLGLVGCGRWGKNYIKSVEPLQGVSIDMICVRHLPKLDQNIRDNYHVTTDLDDILNSDLDGVIIATSPSSHFDLVNRCLDKGLPILLEKPMALDFKEIDSILNRLSNDDLLHVNHQHLYAPAYVKLRELIEDWDGPFFLTSSGGNSGPFRQYDSFLDYGPHDISMVLGILGCHPTDIWISDTSCGKGTIYRVEINYRDLPLKSVNLKSRNITTRDVKHNRATCVFGNGMTTKKRSFSVSTEKQGTILYDDLSPDKLKINGDPVAIDDSLPLSESIISFCNSIKAGFLDWRSSPYLYRSIYSMLNIPGL